MTTKLSRRAVITGGILIPAFALPLPANAATPSPEIVRLLTVYKAKWDEYGDALKVPGGTDAYHDIFQDAKSAAYFELLNAPITCLGDVLVKLEVARIDWSVDEDDTHKCPCRVPEDESHIILSDLWRLGGRP